MTSTALVTGGTGFLGTHLCRRLCEQGWRVHATSRRVVTPARTGVSYYVGDAADRRTARAILDKTRPDVIFHLAGDVGGQPDISRLQPTFESHVVSALNLLSLADEFNVRRLILTGSLLEPVGSELPSSPYAAAKQASTIYARMCHRLYGTHVVVVRPFMTYGPQQKPEKLIPYVIRSYLLNKVPEISSGSWQADWIYVKDVIDGFVAAAVRSGIDGCEIDLGSGRMMTISRIVDEIRAALNVEGEPRYGAVTDRRGEPERAADIDQAYRLLNWVPRVSLREGLRETIKWNRQKLQDC